ncbi:MAG: prepilin-type N-terminal cleavage/methylation domain-containing protein, partial [Verrucomicrobiota bacterium]
MMRDKSALTLIEVLVVIAVLVVLSLWLLAWAVSRRPACADLSIRQVCEMQDTARQNSPKDLLSPSVSSCKMARMAGSDDESKLIEQSLSGDPEAYAALVR